MTCLKLSNGSLINLDHVMSIPSATLIEADKKAGVMVSIKMSDGSVTDVSPQDAYDIWRTMSGIPWS